MKKIYIVDFGSSNPRFLPMMEMFLAHELRRLDTDCEVITVFPEEKEKTLRHLEGSCGPEDMVLLWESKAAKSHHYIVHLFRFAQELHERTRTPIAAGGYWACVLPNAYPELFEPFDTVIQGLNIGKIACFLKEAQADQLPSRYSAEGPCDWDEYQMDMSFLKDPDKYRLGDFVAGYQTSFGCPNNCWFCYNNTLRKIGAEYSLRSEARIREDVASLKRVYGPVRIQMKDLNFFHDKEHALRVLDLVKESSLSIGGYLDITVEDASEEVIRAVADFGCEGLFFGLESFDFETRKRLNKPYSDERLQQLFELGDACQLFLNGSVLTGLPWQSMQDVEREIATAVKAMRRYSYLLIGFNSIRPVLGTELQKRYFPNISAKVNFNEYLQLIAFQASELQRDIYGSSLENTDIQKVHAAGVALKQLKIISNVHCPVYMRPVLEMMQRNIENAILSGKSPCFASRWFTDEKLAATRRLLTKCCKALPGPRLHKRAIH